tara:strand:- start:528 stop:839 length:312 start_codon:yes stop_codon:yes gene_type:complete
MIEQKHKIIHLLKEIGFMVDYSHHQITKNYGSYVLHFKDKTRLKEARNLIKEAKGFTILYPKTYSDSRKYYYEKHNPFPTQNNAIGVQEYLLYVNYDFTKYAL